MIPFNLKCYNEDTGIDEYVKIGLFLQNPEENKELVCDNFVFETNIKYNYGTTTTAAVTVVLTDGTMHKKYEMIGEGHAKTVEIESKKYFVLDSHIKFPVLDDNNDIRYPFEVLSIRYDTSHNRFIGKINTIQNFTYFNIQFSQDEIFKPKIIEKVKKISGVDISSVKEKYTMKYTMRYSENKFANIKMLQNYIDCYSEIKEFRECIEKGIESAYRWVVYKPETIKKKAKEAFTQLNGINIANISDLPSYIKKYINDDKSKDSEKNILYLFRKKFSEEDFKTYKKIFRNFGNVGNKRYENFESFVIHFLGSNVPPKEVLNYIVLNTSKDKNCTVAEFFNRFAFFENAKRYRKIDVEEEMAKAILSGDFKSNLEALNTEVNKIETLRIKAAFKQYPDIDFSEAEDWSNSMAMFRLKDESDLPDRFKQYLSRYRGLLSTRDILPAEDEICFIFNNRSFYSDEKDMDKFLKVDLSNQSIKIYGFITNEYLALLYNDKSSKKKQGYFSQYMTDKDIATIEKLLSEYIYPKYINKKFDQVF